MKLIEKCCIISKFLINVYIKAERKVFGFEVISMTFISIILQDILSLF